MDISETTVERLEKAIEWYDNKSKFNQTLYKYLKILAIIAAAFIPFMAGQEISPVIIGSTGILIVVLEGLQNLNQYHNNWISYRSTCEQLRHEKYLWLAKAGHFADEENPDRLLAERIESIISREHLHWVAKHKKPLKTEKQAPKD